MNKFKSAHSSRISFRTKKIGGRIFPRCLKKKKIIVQFWLIPLEASLQTSPLFQATAHVSPPRYSIHVYPLPRSVVSFLFLPATFSIRDPSLVSFVLPPHTVLLSSSPPLPPPFLDPLIRLMYTGRGKSNKGVGGIRAIRREISSNVELRSLLSLPALILFVKRCRGSRASKIPFRGVWRWRGRGRKEKTNITLGNSTIFLSWSREPNIVHTIFERGRERENCFDPFSRFTRYDIAIDWTILSGLSAQDRLVVTVAKVAWKKVAEDVEQLPWEGGGGCIYDSNVRLT